MYLDLPRELVYALHIEMEDDGILVRLFSIRADELLFQRERKHYTGSIQIAYK
jgi:hypothetical protein